MFVGGVSGFCLRCLNGASLTASISLGSISVRDGVPVANNYSPLFRNAINSIISIQLLAFRKFLAKV